MTVIKRSLVIAGHSTSISLEEPFWRLLKALAIRQNLSLAALVARIDSGRSGTNLSSAIRVHLLEWVMAEGDVRIEDQDCP